MSRNVHEQISFFEMLQRVLRLHLLHGLWLSATDTVLTFAAMLENLSV